MNSIKRYAPFLSLIIIFFGALFLRLFLLQTFPNGLQQDELNAGYQGYKIVKTGTDLLGNVLPYYVNRFGDYRPAGIFYLDGILALFFGLNTFVIRFPAAFVGALSVFVVFLLAKLLSQSNAVALLSALLLAISPWHIVTSRATSEQVIALFFIILGVVFLLVGIKKEGKREYIFAGISFIISYFFYHTPRVFVPLFLISFSLLGSYKPALLGFKQRISVRSALWLLTICMCLLTVGLSLTKAGVGRLSQTSIWGDPKVQAKITTLSNIENGNVLAARLFDNKPIIYGRTFINQYLTYFSPEFLYISGGFPTRYVVPEMGLFYYIEFPFFLLGMFFVLKRKDPFSLILFLWLMIGPFAASLTTEDSPNVERALFMLPAFQIFEGYGIYYTLSLIPKIRRYLVYGFVFLALLVNGIYFFHMYMVAAGTHDAFSRDDGNEMLFSALGLLEGQYKDIYVPSYQDLPLYYYYFSPHKTSLISYVQKDVDKGFSMGKYHFIPDLCPQRVIPKSSLSPNSLLVDFDECSQDASLHEIQKITRQDGTVAYIIKAYSK